jgi:hypothetical protein
MSNNNTSFKNLLLRYRDPNSLENQWQRTTAAQLAEEFGWKGDLWEYIL